MVELLSPAGSIQSFWSAIYGGANAVYLGLDLFSARKNAENFNFDNLETYVRYAHIYGVKVYVALNTLIGDGEMENFLKYAEFCNGSGVDAVLLQDMFLGKLLHKKFPELCLHLSTQAGVNNVYGALVAKEYGFSRVVLARETDKDEIKKICGIIETEVFVQGALCTAFSGQCYMSSFAGNNSGNRGLCKQPCRKLYTLKNGKINKSGYDISLADLCLAPKIDELLSMGVKSFKIEGRMRKPSYVFEATKYYSQLLQGKSPSISPLSRTFKRGNYTLGLGFGQDKNLVSDKVQSHIGETIGKVTKVKDSLKVRSSHTFSPFDSGKILRMGEEVGNYTLDESLNLKYKGKVKVGDDITITTDSRLEDEISKVKILLPVKVDGSFLVGKKAEITASRKGVTVKVESDFVLEKAKNSPLTEAELTDNLSKCGEMPFSAQVSIITDGVFIAKSQLNALRRKLYEDLLYSLAPVYKKPVCNVDFNRPTQKDKSLMVMDDDFSVVKDYDFDIAVFSPNDYGDKKLYDKFFFDMRLHSAKKFLYLPPVLNSADNGLIAPLLQKFDGVYVDGYYGLKLAKEYKIPLILGSGVNIYNSFASYEAQGVYDYIASKELTLKSAETLGGYYYSAGSLKVMDLAYCPFLKTCNDCKGEDISILSDGERDFILRRVKLSVCRFEVYNPYPLLTDGAKRNFFNLLTLSNNQKVALLKAQNCPISAKNAFTDYTTGHSKKLLL